MLRGQCCLGCTGHGFQREGAQRFGELQGCCCATIQPTRLWRKLILSILGVCLRASMRTDDKKIDNFAPPTLKSNRPWILNSKIFSFFHGIQCPADSAPTLRSKFEPNGAVTCSGGGVTLLVQKTACCQLERLTNPRCWKLRMEEGSTASYMPQASCCMSRQDTANLGLAPADRYLFRELFA